MIDDNFSDPFEDAAANAASEIQAEPPAPSNGEGPDDVPFDEVPVRRSRGRPRGRGRARSRRSDTRRSHSRKARPEGESADGAAAGAASGEGVQSPPPPPLKIEPLPPAKLVPFLRQIDKTFTRMIGTAPLDEQELSDGAEACAPVLDHYAPIFLSQPWAGAALWAALVYVPRLDEVISRRKKGGGHQPATFPASSANQAAASATVVEEGYNAPPLG